jgi:hypothetical protein
MRKITDLEIDKLRKIAYAEKNQLTLIPQLFRYFRQRLHAEGESHRARMNRSAAMHFFAAIENCLEDQLAEPKPE